MATQRFTCSEDGTSKFWEISVEGATLTVRYGKLGSEGQAKTKALATPEQAEAERAKLVREKTRKGYVEDTSAPLDAPAASASPAQTPHSAAVAASGSPVVADPRLRLARTFQRGDALFRVAYSDDAVLEQVGDTAPREKKLTSPDAILRAVDKAIEKRIAEGFTEVTSPLPADVDPVTCFDDAALAELHALRRVPGPARVIDLDLAWGVIQSAWTGILIYPSLIRDADRRGIDSTCSTS